MILEEPLRPLCQTDLEDSLCLAKVLRRQLIEELQRAFVGMKVVSVPVEIKELVLIEFSHRLLVQVMNRYDQAE